MAHSLAHSSPPFHHMDLSSSACAECIVDCHDAACEGELGERCTDQCVIVACDNPDHENMQCSRENCKATCEDPTHCPLPVHSFPPCEEPHHKDVSCTSTQDRCIGACESSCSDPRNCPFGNAVSTNRSLQLTI
ncbi:hypothetical protein BC834DRAFT_362681 [Gloeopeniophorella convolvens]|nr:hypothetical protein BC834DRAFT_362681 [Gloeopeniophorella convolvens]